MHSSVHTGIIYNNKDTDTIWGSIDRWINKDTHTQTHMNIAQTLKRMKSCPFQQHG